MTRSICTIEGCEGRVVGRGYCRKHYTRWDRYGDPLAPLRRRGNTNSVHEDDWFWQHVDKSAGPEACWPWTGTKTKAGYGHTRHSCGTRLAHRVAFFLTYGYLPESGDHECHNLDSDCRGGITDPHRACCNPTHVVDRPRPDNAVRGKTTRRFCPNGHEYAPGPHRCPECQRHAVDRTLAKQRELRAEFGPGRGLKPSEACINGHPWVEGSYYESQGHRKCRICHLGLDPNSPQKRRPRATAEACPHGHPWTEGSYYFTRSGTRKCYECKREYERRGRTRAKER